MYECLELADAHHQHDDHQHHHTNVDPTVVDFDTLALQAKAASSGSMKSFEKVLKELRKTY